MTLCLNRVTFLTLEDLTVFFFPFIFIDLVVLIQRNSALRNEAMAYLISELVTCLPAACFALLVEETAIKYGCRKRLKLKEKNKIKVDKAVSDLFKKIKLFASVIKLFTKAQI